MQVQKICNKDNYNNYNQCFKALRFGYNSQDISRWEPRILDHFVHDKKIQEFIKVMHSKGKDVLATDNQIFENGKFIQSSFNLDILDSYTNMIEYSLPNMTLEDLKGFSVQKIVSNYENVMKNKSPFQKYIMEFIKNLNDSL